MSVSAPRTAPPAMFIAASSVHASAENAYHVGDRIGHVSAGVALPTYCTEEAITPQPNGQAAHDDYRTNQHEQCSSYR